jgi:hypothetical protein
MVANDDVDLSSLLAEQSLFEVYRKAPSFFSNRFNGCVLVLAGSGLMLFSCVHLFSPSIRESFRISFADTFAIWSNVGSALAGTILGFLIAGFAILCTVLRPQTMIALQRILNKKYRETQLKLLFVHFVEVLVQYLALLMISVLVMVFGGKLGPAAVLGSYLAKIHWMIPQAMVHIIYAAWGTFFVVVVLTLKSFVYNLYSTLLLGIADAADDYQRSCKKSNSENASDRLDKL